RRPAAHRHGNGHRHQARSSSEAQHRRKGSLQMKKLIAFLLVVLFIATPAFAQNNMDEGRKHFQAGVQFYKEGDFRAALIEFKRAYESAPNYKVLYNLGQTNLELQDYAQALTSFQKYLTDGGKD